MSGTDLPVERDSLPLHLIGKGPAETERELAQFLVERPKLWHEYGGWLATLHQEAYREVEAMAKTKRRKFLILTWGRSWRPWKRTRHRGPGGGDCRRALTSDKILKQLSPQTCRELIEVLRRKAGLPAEPPSQ